MEINDRKPAFKPPALNRKMTNQAGTVREENERAVYRAELPRAAAQRVSSTYFIGL
jgi:hypothetical protein